MQLRRGGEIGTARFLILANSFAVLGGFFLLPSAAEAQIANRADQAYYHNARPMLDYSFPDLLKAVPELQGLEPAQNQDQLPTILSKTGDVTEELMAGMQNLISTENVTQSKPAKKGRGIDQRQSKFDYLIVVHRYGKSGTLDEYRTGAEWIGLSGLEEGYTLTRGFASAWLRFLPLNQREMRSLYLGRQTRDGRKCYVVAFAQIPGMASLTGKVNVGGTSLVILYQGIAWIDEADFRIVRMRLDLLAPRPDVGLETQTTDLHFSETRLPEIAAPLWLPQEVNVTTRMNDRLYQNVHRYTDYRVFKVESKIMAISEDPSVPMPDSVSAQAQAPVEIAAQRKEPPGGISEIPKSESDVSTHTQDNVSQPQLTQHPQVDPTQPTFRENVVKSHRRVVRLYLEVGKVEVKHPGSAKEEQVLANTPMEEGSELSTSGGGDAIVEFENSSTAILGERSQLLFLRLSSDENGNRLSGMTLEQGSATFHFLPEHHSLAPRNRNEIDDSALFVSTQTAAFEVKLADIIVTADRKCRFRADVEGDHIRVEVFSGDVLVATPTQASTVSKGSSMEHISGGTEAAFDIHNGIKKDAWDQWAEAQELRLLSGAGSATDPNGASRTTLPDSPTLR